MQYDSHVGEKNIRIVESIGGTKLQDSLKKRVHSSKTFHLTLIGNNRQNELKVIRSFLYRK